MQKQSESQAGSINGKQKTRRQGKDQNQSIKTQKTSGNTTMLRKGQGVNGEFK